jgi:hypothetical protein
VVDRIPSELLSDAELLNQMLVFSGKCLANADPSIIADKEFMFHAISTDPTNYMYASDALKNNKEFAIKVLSSYGYCYK